jgi:hypothetical protein
MNEINHEAIEQRLQRLEKQNTDLKRGILGICVFLCLLCLWGFAQTDANKQPQIDPPKQEDNELPILEARELRLRNSEGKLVAWLKPVKDGVQFSLLDPNGIPRVQLGIDEYAAQITLAGENRYSQLVMESMMYGPQINLYDTKGTNRAILGMYEGDTYFWLMDPAEKQKLGFSINEEQMGMVFTDSKNVDRIHMGMDQSDTLLHMKNAEDEDVLFIK